jgi:hypothetical protein
MSQKNRNDSKSFVTKQMLKKLIKQLSNNSRELQLSQEINKQLEKIRLTSIKIKDILNRLLYENEDLTQEELEDLHQKEYEAKIELKRLETRYQMLKSVQNNECLINVKPIAYKSDNNHLIINNKRVLIEGIDSDEDEEEDDETIVDSENHSSDTDIEDNESSISNNTNGYYQRLSPRKRIIPERFESFPSKKSSKRLNGMP